MDLVQYASPSVDEKDIQLSQLLLPELWLKVLSYLSYDQISKLRLVCRDMNEWCMDTLNQGFSKVEAILGKVQKEIKFKLPRRESERRAHPLSRHADILSAIETRMSLLQITYNKYIESGYICFIPGSVLDELMTVLRFVAKKESNAPRAHEILMELRDISSMAMEHFEDKILPLVRNQLDQAGLAVLPGGLTVDSDYVANRKELIVKRSLGSPVLSSPPKRPRFSGVSPRLPCTLPFCSASPSTSSFSSSFHHEPSDTEQLEQRLQEAECVIRQQSNTLQQQKRSIEELTRCFHEYKHNFKTLSCILQSYLDPSKMDTAHQGISHLIARMDVQSLPTIPISTSISPDCNPVLARVKARASRRLAHNISTSERRAPATRAKQLHERMDDFKDELRL